MPRVPTVIPEPMLARLADRLPTGAAWSYEVKWDAYRCLALKVGDAVTLRSRNASNFTASYRHRPLPAECVADGDDRLALHRVVAASLVRDVRTRKATLPPLAAAICIACVVGS